MKDHQQHSSNPLAESKFTLTGVSELPPADNDSGQGLGLSHHLSKPKTVSTSSAGSSHSQALSTGPLTPSFPSLPSPNSRGSPFWSGYNPTSRRHYSRGSSSYVTRATSKPLQDVGHCSSPPAPPQQPLPSQQTLPAPSGPVPASSGSPVLNLPQVAHKEKLPEVSPGLPKPPKKRILDDSSWLQGRKPPVPEKAPLRELLFITPEAAKRLSPLSEPSDEDLRRCLQPQPLRSCRPPVSPLGQTRSPPSPHPQPTTTRDLQKSTTPEVVSTQSLPESTEEDLPSPVEFEEAVEIQRQRKLTLEALEGLPTPSFSEIPESLLKLIPVRRFSQIFPEIELLSQVGTAPAAMSSLHPNSAAALTQHRREAIRLAKAQERAVAEKCKRSNQAIPPYSFDELIGKGTFGRVYKGRQSPSNKVVAIKVLDIDDTDFQALVDQKDEQIRDFNREIKILRQAQESGAVNLNQIIEALPVHSQLWMVCEHCPGGSVKTLMRATDDRLAEKYIVIVARELAKALKGLHIAGIIHRDVKCANVLIHEEGRLELCDFGVANVLDTRTDKRRTFIGTLHWMPPELWSEQPEYSDEVDVWGFGCTLHECAIGRPPNSDLRERQQLKTRMRRLKAPVSLPEAEKSKFSQGLQSLIEFVLNPDPATRPSMKDVLEHDYLLNSEETHPTSSLSELVQNYYSWLYRGGLRVSLFMPGGAAAANEDPDVSIQDSDDWNFSMTQDFERRMSQMLEIPPEVLEIPDFSDNLSGPGSGPEGDDTPKQSTAIPLSPPQNLTAAQRANFEMRVNRGAADLSNLFDQSAPAYEYKAKSDFVPIPEPRRISDLPFRAMAEDRPSSIASNVIDLGEFDESDYAAAAPRTDDNIHIQTAYAIPLKEETIRLADASTLRQKRADSKGPRDPPLQSLTIRRASSADGASTRRSGAAIATSDFAAAQEDWPILTKARTAELSPPFREEDGDEESVTTGRPGHATMDWSFSSAMAGMIPSHLEAQEAANMQAQYQTQEEDYPKLIVDDMTYSEPGPEEESSPIYDTAKPSTNVAPKSARATLDWSFSSAMSELNAESSTASKQQTAPKRNLLVRQMTMPVTQDDFSHTHAPDPNLMDAPRPPTALSEAYSESSQSSADVDPFGLEEEGDGMLGHNIIEGARAAGWYATRGHEFDDIPAGTIREPSAAATTAPAAPAAAAAAQEQQGGYVQAYPFGRPPQIDSPSFPGLDVPHMVTAGARASSRAHSSVASAELRPSIEVPPVAPPSMSVMANEASAEDMADELTRLLDSLQGHMAAASTVVQSSRGRGRSLRRGDGESDWEDEE